MSNDRFVLKNDDELLNAFADLLSEVVPEDQEEIEALLVAVGLDPAEVRQEATELIKDLRAKTPLDWRNRQAQLDEADNRHRRAGTDLPEDRQGLMEKLRQLMSIPGLEQVHAHLRGHEPNDFSDGELRSLIQDLEFVLEESQSKRNHEDG
jgi:hypothetical protein